MASRLRATDLEEKGDGLIGRVFGKFLIEVFDYDVQA